MDIGSSVKSVWAAIVEKVRQADTVGFYIFVMVMTLILLFSAGMFVECGYRHHGTSEVVPEVCVESVEFVSALSGRVQCSPGAIMIHEHPGIPGVTRERIVCKCPQETFDEEGDVEHLPLEL